MSGSAASPGGCWPLRPEPRKLPARQAPPGPQPSQQRFPSLSATHCPRCSEGRKPGRPRLTKSDSSVSRGQTSPSTRLAFSGPPTPQVSLPQTCRGSRCGRDAVTEMRPFPPVRWVRRPGRLTGLPSWEAQCCGGGGSLPGSLSPPELVLGIAEALRHKVDGLVGLVLVGLHGRRIRVEGPDLGLLGKGVLAGGRGPGSQDPRGLEPQGPTGTRPPLEGPPEAWRWCPWEVVGTASSVPPAGQPPAQPPGRPEPGGMAKVVLPAGPRPRPSLGAAGVSPGAPRRRRAAPLRRPSPPRPAYTARTPR